MIWRGTKLAGHMAGEYPYRIVANAKSGRFNSR